jgi:hypothetical protein
MPGAATLRSALAAALLLAAAVPSGAQLEVLERNPRWLTADGGATGIVLTGAHTWDLFQDYRFSRPFDARGYLDGLERSGHNFTRGWYWEDGYYSPLPYVERGGRYRLSPPYDAQFIRRVRRRIRAAERRGLFVSVMLFQGWSMDDRSGTRSPGPWPEHPYNPDNTDERVTKQRSALHIGLAQQQQLEYVSYMARKLCSAPNIIWEIANEAVPDSFGTARASNWQRNILRHLRQECGDRLVWVSCPWQAGLDGGQRLDLLTAMYEMEADLVAPCDPNGVYSRHPPANQGAKVVVADTDHLDPAQIDADWVWKSFLRGQHPVFMDLSRSLAWWNGFTWDAEDERWRAVHGALGSVQELVRTVNRERADRPNSGLADLVPQGGVGGRPGDSTRPASSRWTLFSSNRPCPAQSRAAGCGSARANGDEILALALVGETIAVCRLQAGESYRYRWKRSARRGYLGPAQLARADGQGCLAFANPGDESAVVHVERVVAPG